MDDVQEIGLNRAQAIIHAVNANKTYNLWGRGTGKSNGGIGPRSVNLFDKMPRAQIGFVVPSYVMGFKNILPNIIGFWQNHMGLVDGENFVFGKRPPDDWPKPIIPIMDHKYVISFDTGNSMPIVSLEVEGAANGYNMQALLGDEGKFFDEKKLKEVKRAVRGCNREFGHLAEFQSEWYFSDKYQGDVEWMLKKRSLVKPELVKAVIAIAIKLDELQTTFDQSNDPVLFADIAKKTALLNKVRQSMVYVSEFSAEENREILGDKFFSDQKEDSTRIEYDVAILNQDPDEVPNSFYPSLKPVHYYHATNDVVDNKPLIIACDYQWRISPIVTAQFANLLGQPDISLNFVHSCHSLDSEGLKEAIDKWAHHFRNHGNKLVYYLFDKTAVGKNPTSKPYYEVVIERLRYNGWRVSPQNMGNTPAHDDKFKLISKYLNGVTNCPAIRINALRNTDMVISIKKSAALTYNGKTKKDKTNEKNMSIPAVKTTHYSDTFDQVIIGALDLNMVPKSGATFVGSAFS